MWNLIWLLVTPAERLQGQQQEQLPIIRSPSLGCYWGEDCEQVLHRTVHHLIGHWGISPAWEDGHHGQFTWTHWSQRFKSNRQRLLNNVSTVFWWTWTHLGTLLLWLKAMNWRQIHCNYETRTDESTNYNEVKWREGKKRKF